MEGTLNRDEESSDSVAPLLGTILREESGRQQLKDVHYSDLYNSNN